MAKKKTISNAQQRPKSKRSAKKKQSLKNPSIPILPDQTPPRSISIKRVVLVTVVATALVVMTIIFSVQKLFFGQIVYWPNFQSSEEPIQYKEYQIPLGISLNQTELTADWQFYQNTTTGYSLKYPATWQLAVLDQDLNLTNELFPEINFYLTATSTNLSLEDYLARSDRNFTEESVIDQAAIRIDGLPAIKRYLILNNDLQQLETYLHQAPKIFHFSLTSPVIDQPLDQFYDQILSTFRFQQTQVTEENNIQE